MIYVLCFVVATASFAIGIKICAITAGIKNISQLSKKRKKIIIRWYF